MQDERRMSFSDRVAVGMVLGFGVLLLAGIIGGVPEAVMIAGWAVTVFGLVIVWRVMRAHERVADALERIAQQKEKGI